MVCVHGRHPAAASTIRSRSRSETIPAGSTAADGPSSAATISERRSSSRASTVAEATHAICSSVTLLAQPGTNNLLQVLRRVAHGFTNPDNFAARGGLGSPRHPRSRPYGTGSDHSVALVYRRLETSWWAVRGGAGCVLRRSTSGPGGGQANRSRQICPAASGGPGVPAATHHAPPPAGPPSPPAHRAGRARCGGTSQPGAAVREATRTLATPPGWGRCVTTI